MDDLLGVGQVSPRKEFPAEGSHALTMSAPQFTGAQHPAARPHDFNEDESRYRQAMSTCIRTIAQDVNQDLTPRFADIVRMTHLLGASRHDGDFYINTCADLLHVLCKRPFRFHSMESGIELEWHLRVIAAAIRQLGPHIVRFHARWQDQLRASLNTLYSFVGNEQSNPAPRFLFAVIRNAIDGKPNDESRWAATIRTLIIPAELSIGAAVGSPGLVGDGVLRLGEYLQNLRRAPDAWYQSFVALRAACETLAEHGPKAPNFAEMTDALLDHSLRVAHHANNDFGARKTRFMAMFKKQWNVLPFFKLDNTWDLFFGVLDLVHFHLPYLTAPKHAQAILDCLSDIILRAHTHHNVSEPILFKAIEIAYDLRATDAYKIHCDILLRAAVQKHKVVFDAVYQKVTSESRLCHSVLIDMQTHYTSASRPKNGLRSFLVQGDGSLLLRPYGSMSHDRRATAYVCLPPPHQVGTAHLEGQTPVFEMGQAAVLKHLRPGDLEDLLQDAIERDNGVYLGGLLDAGLHVDVNAVASNAFSGPPHTALGRMVHHNAQACLACLATRQKRMPRRAMGNIVNTNAMQEAMRFAAKPVCSWATRLALESLK